MTDITQVIVTGLVGLSSIFFSRFIARMASFEKRLGKIEEASAGYPGDIERLKEDVAEVRQTITLLPKQISAQIDGITKSLAHINRIPGIIEKVEEHNKEITDIRIDTNKVDTMLGLTTRAVEAIESGLKEIRELVMDLKHEHAGLMAKK